MLEEPIYAPLPNSTIFTWRKKIHQMTHLNVSYEPIQFTANFHRCDNLKIIVIKILKNKFSKLLGSKLNMK